MKKYSILIIAIALVASLLGIEHIYAQEGQREQAGNTNELPETMQLNNQDTPFQGTMNPATIRETMQTRKMEMKNVADQYNARREAIRNKMDQMRGSANEDASRRLQGREQALLRFDNAIDRVWGMKERVEAQLPALAQLGVDISVAQTNLIEVENKLILAKNLTAEIHETLANTSEVLTQEEKTLLRQKAMETQALIKEAHAMMVSTVVALKQAVQSLRVSAMNADNNTDAGEDTTEETVE